MIYCIWNDPSSFFKPDRGYLDWEFSSISSYSKHEQTVPWNRLRPATFTFFRIHQAYLPCRYPLIEHFKRFNVSGGTMSQCKHACYCCLTNLLISYISSYFLCSFPKASCGHDINNSSFIFRYITPYIQMTENRRFGGTCRLHFQGGSNLKQAARSEPQILLINNCWNNDGYEERPSVIWRERVSGYIGASASIVIWVEGSGFGLSEYNILLRSGEKMDCSDQYRVLLYLNSSKWERNALTLSHVTQVLSLWNMSSSHNKDECSRDGWVGTAMRPGWTAEGFGRVTRAFSSPQRPNRIWGPITPPPPPQSNGDWRLFLLK
jgi:hypothetical protein